MSIDPQAEAELDYRTACARTLVRIVLDQAPALSLTTQLRAYDGIADVLTPLCPAEATAARAAAEAMRQAETQQMHFTDLFLKSEQES